MKKILALILTLSLVLVLFTGCNSGKYDDAKALYDSGKYKEAAAKFKELGDYEDSPAMLSASNYAWANELLEAGDFDAALSLYTDLNDYEDSAVKVNACIYGKAVSMIEAGNYTEAITLLESITDYEDAADQLMIAKAELQYQSYAPVIDLLSAENWFCNGGTENSLNCFVFSKENVFIKHVFFDGNGYQQASENTLGYTVDDATISMTLEDGSELSIPYVLDGDSLKLGSGDYFSASEVDAALQGYWYCNEYTYIKLMSHFSNSKYNAYFHDGIFEYESASEAYGYNDGSYYYYGPYKDSYTLGLGNFETDIHNGSQWFFNIIDGEVKLMHFDHVFSKVSSGMPGEDGYSF